MNHIKKLALYLLCILTVALSSMPCSSAIASVPRFAIALSEKFDSSQLKDFNIVYLGENHDNIEHHRAELEIIKNLEQENTSIAIALEMFQRPFQPILDSYLAGDIDETELRERTEYDKRWVFDWEYYAPILRWARSRQIPLIALNTPSEITRKVGEFGLNSLDGDDFRYIPPRADIDLSNIEYRQLLEEIYIQHGENDLGNSDRFENFLAAQILWDETMAEAIASYYQFHPQKQIVVLVGKGHIFYDYAIPNRVTRRIDRSTLQQKSILLGN